MAAKDKIAGALFGQAIGDAIAYQTEFLPLKTITEKYGDDLSFPDTVTVTDDTTMMLAVARALPRARSQTPRELVRVLLTEFLEWGEDPSNRDDTALSNSLALDRLKSLRANKRSWTEGTTYTSASVALTRATPVAFAENDMAGVVQLQTALTHADPVALAATEAYVVALRLLADNNESFTMFRKLITFVQGKRNQENLYLDSWLGKLDGMWPETGHMSMRAAWLRVRDILYMVEELLAESRSPRDVCAVLGNGFSADTAFANGLYFYLKHEDNPVTAILEAAKTSGDSTAIAAVTGALAGAAHGVKVWPSSWKFGVNVRDRISSATEGLYGMRVPS